MNAFHWVWAIGLPAGLLLVAYAIAFFAGIVRGFVRARRSLRSASGRPRRDDVLGLFVILALLFGGCAAPPEPPASPAVEAAKVRLIDAIVSDIAGADDQASAAVGRPSIPPPVIPPATRPAPAPIPIEPIADPVEVEPIPPAVSLPRRGFRLSPRGPSAELFVAE